MPDVAVVLGVRAIDGEMVRTHLGEYLELLGEDGSLEPEAIAEAHWFLHKHDRKS